MGDSDCRLSVCSSSVIMSADKGEALFKGRCAQCHTYQEGGPNKQGPNLWGIIGRTAGTVEGYAYTKANKESGIVWQDDTLCLPGEPQEVHQGHQDGLPRL